MVVSISLWLHIVAVVLAIGGTSFILFVLGPTLRRGVAGEAQQQIFAGIRGRFFPIVWGSIAVILISGLAAAGSLQVLRPQVLFGTTYGWLLTTKIVLALMLFTCALLITLPNEGLARFRARAVQYQRMIVSIAVIIILIATSLRYMPR
ncbi:MAG: CopD family protein [Chloroflexota bacterium]